MDALFCPLAADVGNWADWVNVVAAATVGFAVWRVSKRTNELAQAANRTSESVAQLEVQRELEAAKLRQDEQRLILVTMANPISMALVAVRTTDQLLRSEEFLGRFRASQDVRDFISHNLRHGLFTIPESTRARMHFVEVKIAAQVLRAVGGIPMFLKAIEGIGSTSADVRAFGVNQLCRAMSRELEELEEAWSACLEACREAGLKVGPPESEQPTEGAPAASE